MRPSSRFPGILVVLLSFVLLPSHAFAAGSGAIRGRVLDPDGKAVPGVPVQLRNDITGFKADTTTGPDGTFQFFNVPFNP